MAKIRLDDTTEFEVDVPITEMSSLERTKKSLKIFGVWFVITVLSIAVPVFHFILVPALLVTAIAMGLRQYRKIFAFDLAGVKCPKCKKDLNEKVITASAAKISVYCFNCRMTMSVAKQISSH